MCTCTIPLSTSAAGWTLCSPSSLDCRYAQRHVHRSHSQTHSQITLSHTLTDHTLKHTHRSHSHTLTDHTLTDHTLTDHTLTHTHSFTPYLFLSFFSHKTQTHTHTHRRLQGWMQCISQIPSKHATRAGERLDRKST